VPCFRHSDVILVPRDHPLLQLETRVTLHDLAKYPLITYEPGAKGRVQVEEAFERSGLVPNVVLDAITADVIKTYVALGLGVGVVASIAWDEERDSDQLRMIDAAHLFPISTTRLAWTRGRRLPKLAMRFVETFAPALAMDVKQALSEATAA
jgi:LysR family cys regulon transcriptional activator